MLRIRVFASRGTYRQRMGTGGLPGPPHPSSAWPHLGPRTHRVWGPRGSPPGALRTPEASQTFIYGGKDSSDSEDILRVGFLKPKTVENRELALWHLVNRLVQKMHKNAMKCK